MTRFCSDITPHMRLFELIRQQNLVALRRDAMGTHTTQSTPADFHQFVVQAKQSFSYESAVT